MSVAETIQHEGYTITMMYDEDPTSSRDCDQLGVMLLLGSRSYTLGDAQVFRGTQRATDYARAGDYYDAEKAHNHFMERLNTGQALRALVLWLKIYKGATVVLPVGMIDHSGLSFYIGGVSRFDPGGWDSGMVGFIFDTEGTRQTTGCTPENGFDAEKITKALTGEVEEYDKVATGDVYGYKITDSDGDDVDIDDSCWGLIGSEWAIEAAKEAVTSEIEYRKTHPKTAATHRVLATFTVKDFNLALGRNILQTELDAVTALVSETLTTHFEAAAKTMATNDTTKEN